MGLPLLGPLRVLLRARADEAAGRLGAALATALLASVAVFLAVSAGLVGLTQAIGYPLAAMVFATLFAVLALGAHLFGRVHAARRSARADLARHQAEADLALASAVAQSGRPLLPFAAFLAAFALARRP